jgi:L-lysine 6-transaminase
MNPKDVVGVVGSRVLADGQAVVVDLKRSSGSWLVDARDGRTYLDCFSQFASQALGWNHPKMLAGLDRLAGVCVNRVANSDMYTEQYAEFVSEFSGFTPDFKHHFYICGGALAVENGLKAAFDWKFKKMGLDESRSGELGVVYLNEAFHGRSGYTMSMTNNGDVMNPKVYGFPKFSWKKVRNPKVWHDRDGRPHHAMAKNSEDVALREAEMALSSRKVAAIVMEPIQGEGGDNHFRREFLAGMRELADRYEALLVFDEVQTGLGLTGRNWAYEHFGVVPDVMCFGKKVQVCGIVAGDRLDEVEKNVFTEPSRINSTWGGNIVDMVRSTMQMEIIREEGLVDNAMRVGRYLLTKLLGFQGRISNVRGRGLMVAFDLDSREDRDGFLARAEANDLLVLPCGEKSVRLRPHLTFTNADADEAISRIESSL